MPLSVTADSQQIGDSVIGKGSTGYNSDLTPDHDYLTEIKGRCWEIQEVVTGSQIVDVQGRLNIKYQFLEGGPLCTRLHVGMDTVRI